ncbi:bile acid:sodium symporter family protein [Paenibacillus sp. y28]|uniref:bile acid:sodium symporter family protein n=1 Tax=Paenibacillus sp. y28 TaxID=3129110 RepID=UPI00301AA5AB
MNTPVPDCQHGGGQAALGLRLNQWFEKYMFAIIPAALLVGFVFHRGFMGYTGWVPFLFAYMTFVMALGCSSGQMRQALLAPRPMLVTFALTHMVAPLLAFVGGSLVFGPDSHVVIGLVLFTAIPLGVSSIIWIGMAKGNVPLALCMVVLDSALSVFVVPALIWLFFGHTLTFDYLKVMADLLFIVVIPTICGVLVNDWSRGRAKSWSAPVTLPLSKFVFTLIILINAAAIAPQVAAHKQEMLLMVPVVVLLVFLCYAIGFAGSRLFRDPRLTITLSYSSGMRNVSLGIVIAIGYFEPLAAVPVVLGILIQQPTATLFYVVLRRYKAAVPQ